MGVRGALYHSLFLGLAVLNMVAAFQALGTLMATLDISVVNIALPTLARVAIKDVKLLTPIPWPP